MNETICMVMSIKLWECDFEQGGFLFGGVGIVCGRSVVQKLMSKPACYKLCVTCTWWLLGLVMKEQCLGLGGPTPVLTVWTSLEDTPSRGLVSCKEGCLGCEQVYDDNSTDYCMIVNEWTLRLCILIEYRSMGT